MCSLESHSPHQWSDFNLANGSILPSLIEMVYPDLLVGFFFYMQTYSLSSEIFFFLNTYKYLKRGFYFVVKFLNLKNVTGSDSCAHSFGFPCPIPLYKLVLFMVFEANISFSLDLNRKIRLLSCWVSALSLQFSVCADRFESRQMRHEFGQIK